MNPKELLDTLPKHVKLVAVSKMHSKEEIDALAQSDYHTFGENRVQELKDKYTPDYEWHMIGHLQRNKVKDVVPLVSMIQSLDRESLAEEIEKQCAKINKIMDVLIEVNISKESSKTGIQPEQCLSFLKKVSTYPHLHVKGLMCIGPFTDNQTQIKECFSKMHDLYLQAQTICPSIDTLSMGMSNDYELAIECGSNMIRLGTILFGKRKGL